MIRLSLALLFCVSAIYPQPVDAQIAVGDTTRGPFPSWDWRLSQRLLIAPSGQCGPTITPPGTLVEAHLLAWTTRPLAPPGTRVYEALWWGRYRTVTGDSVWALARGYHHPSPIGRSARAASWSLGYVCDGNSHPFAIFPNAPTADELRAFSQGFVGASVNRPLLEVGIRRTLLHQLVGDSLAISQTIFAQSTELKQYIAIRDSFERRIPPWPSKAKIDWGALSVIDRDVRQRLAPLARAIVGPFDVSGFVQPGIFNVNTFLPGSEDSFLADGIRYSSVDGKTDVFVSTPDLIRVWKSGDPIKTLKSLKSLNGIFPADAGITPYAVIPVAKPGQVLLAVLMARQQDYGPSDPDRILLSLVRGGQLVVVEAAAPVIIAVPACKGAHWLKPLDALRPPATAAESLFTYPFTEDAGYRACYSRGVVNDPRWPQVVAKAEQLAASVLGG